MDNFTFGVFVHSGMIIYSIAQKEKKIQKFSL